MKKALLLLFLFPLLSHGQKLNKQGLEEHYLLAKGDSVNFYIYNPDRLKKTKVFLFLQGSKPTPMISSTDSVECCFNNFPRSVMRRFPKDYAFVYIQKVGVPYYANTDHFTASAKFNERNNVLDRAEVASKVLTYVVDKLYPKANVVAVLGHSEGSDVAARLAVINKKVTHLGFASGNGAPQMFNDVLFIRRKMHSGEIDAEEAQAQLDTYFTGMESVFKRPGSVTDTFRGDTYKWHYAINQPPIENLLKLKIPIFLTIGSNDNAVPIEASDYIKSEFIRLQKDNLTYKVYPNSNHSYVETLPNGETRDHWLDLFDDFAEFIKNNSR
ncbi:dienelactone hydrolase family protein [Pontibacter sp. HSC-14F20]|uniref:alpha/beta hydrolase n=1 Tax=Pontibacter sp. HSC-14F20 TaxID=2864136 RepID=UPI001C735E18|nr:dienelactone hydrolase family protein [Pontibacter sp. HSC-14F20]MBX0332835.1 dienelactone hydrolase family protein [Pontibacter sp. HSC-14F20]